VTRQWRWVRGRAAALVGLARRWQADLRGGSLVQFVAILPVLVLVVIGMWALFTVYSAQQTLCEAVYEASRYLQVEGPQFNQQGGDPAGYSSYPDEWELLATEIINEELRSNTMTRLGPITPDDVEITPPQMRRDAKEMDEITWENVEMDWFFIHAQATITNPLALWVDGRGEGNSLLIQCKGTGFFESPPIGPSPGPGQGGKPINCPPRPPICTPGPKPTDCPVCTPTPVPTCLPCRPR